MSFFKAYKEGMLFPKYIWMIIGWYSDKWYLEGKKDEIKCNKSEMERAVYGHFTTEVQFFTNNLFEKLDYGIVSVIFSLFFQNKSAKKAMHLVI